MEAASRRGAAAAEAARQAEEAARQAESARDVAVHVRDEALAAAAAERQAAGGAAAVQAAARGAAAARDAALCAARSADAAGRKAERCAAEVHDVAARAERAAEKAQSAERKTAELTEATEVAAGSAGQKAAAAVDAARQAEGVRDAVEAASAAAAAAKRQVTGGAAAVQAAVRDAAAARDAALRAARSADAAVRKAERCAVEVLEAGARGVELVALCASARQDEAVAAGSRPRITEHPARAFAGADAHRAPTEGNASAAPAVVAARAPPQVVAARGEVAPARLPRDRGGGEVPLPLSARSGGAGATRESAEAPSRAAAVDGVDGVRAKSPHEDRVVEATVQRCAARGAAASSKSGAKPLAQRGRVGSGTRPLSTRPREAAAAASWRALPVRAQPSLKPQLDGRASAQQADPPAAAAACGSGAARCAPPVAASAASRSADDADQPCAGSASFPAPAGPAPSRQRASGRAAFSASAQQNAPPPRSAIADARAKHKAARAGDLAASRAKQKDKSDGCHKVRVAGQWTWRRRVRRLKRLLADVSAELRAQPTFAPLALLLRSRLPPVGVEWRARTLRVANALGHGLWLAADVRAMTERHGAGVTRAHAERAVPALAALQQQDLDAVGQLRARADVEVFDPAEQRRFRDGRCGAWVVRFLAGRGGELAAGMNWSEDQVAAHAAAAGVELAYVGPARAHGGQLPAVLHVQHNARQRGGHWLAVRAAPPPPSNAATQGSSLARAADGAEHAALPRRAAAAAVRTQPPAAGAVDAAGAASAPQHARVRWREPGVCPVCALPRVQRAHVARHFSCGDAQLDAWRGTLLRNHSVHICPARGHRMYAVVHWQSAGRCEACDEQFVDTARMPSPARHEQACRERALAAAGAGRTCLRWGRR